MSGRLKGIARRSARRAAMETVEEVAVTVAAGVAGDHKGAKFKNRQVTILAREDWAAALEALAATDGVDGAGRGAPALDWTCRRANLLVEGLRLPRAKGAAIAIGEEVELEVTGETVPCARMDEAFAGLRKALHPAWRGGVTCRVITGGQIRLGDQVRVMHQPDEVVRRLPG